MRGGEIAAAIDCVLSPTWHFRLNWFLVPLIAAGLLGCRSGPWPFSAPPTLAERAAAILAEAIRIPSVNPPGNEAPLARYYAGQLRRAGLEARLIPTPTGDAWPEGARRTARAAVWARLPGRGRFPPLVLLSHLDVVPADPRLWSSDPFAGARRQGYVVGRGALDAKGVSVVHLLALAELRRRGRVLARDVLFLATPDEEAGGVHGAGWIARERPDLLGGAEYVLTEGGGIVPARDQTPAIWGIAVTEKSPCWLRLAVRGTPGHSSAPPRDAAGSRLIAALDRVRRMSRPLRVVPPVARMFAALGPAASPEDAPGFADLAAHLANDPAFRSRFLARRGQAALVQDTLAITVLEGSQRTNVLAAEAVAHLDVRLLPDARCGDFVRQVRLATGDPGVSVEPLLSFPSSESPLHTSLYNAIARVAARDPRAVVVPRVVAGFTDAHYFREIGIAAYGFTPRWLRAADASGIHGPDERISLENLERGVETLIEVLLELDRHPPG